MNPADIDRWRQIMGRRCPSGEPGRSEWINAYEHIQALTAQGKLREPVADDDEADDYTVDG